MSIKLIKKVVGTTHVTKVYWNSELQEFRVRLFKKMLITSKPNGEGWSFAYLEEVVDADYFTTDGNDALDTAAVMVQTTPHAENA